MPTGSVTFNDSATIAGRCRLRRAGRLRLLCLPSTRVRARSPPFTAQTPIFGEQRVTFTGGDRVHRVHNNLPLQEPKSGQNADRDPHDLRDCKHADRDRAWGREPLNSREVRPLEGPRRSPAAWPQSVQPFVSIENSNHFRGPMAGSLASFQGKYGDAVASRQH